MLRLKSVYIRNFNRVKEARVEFPKAGLVAVVGVNHASEGKAESVAVGKTSLGEAIVRVLFDVKGRFTDFSGHSTDGAAGKAGGNTYVMVTADLDGETLVVEQGYRCPELSRTGEGLRWKLGNRKAVERGHLRETRAELAALLLPSLSAEWSVFLDGAKLRFNDLSQDEAVELLLAFLAQPPWDLYQDKARKAASKAETQLEVATQRQQACHRDVERLTAAVAEAKAKLAQAAANRQTQLATWVKACEGLQAELAALEQRLVEVKAEHKEVSKALAAAVDSADEKYKQAELKLAQLTSKVEEGNRLVAAWDSSCEKADTEARVARRELDKLKAIPDRCPTCDKPWDRHPDQAMLSAAQDRLTTALAECKAYEASLATARDYAARQRAKKSEAQRALEAEKASKVADLSDKLSQLDRVRAQTHERIQALQRRVPAEPTNAEVEAWQTRLEEREAQLNYATAPLESAVQARLTEERKLALARYWVKGLGVAGVQNLVLRYALPPLNQTAEAVSLAMVGSFAGVEFEADTALASGETKPKLTVKAKTTFGSSKLGGNSKGESGLVNLVIAESQALVGRVFDKVGFRWLDEAVNTQDPLVRKQVFQYLHRQAHEHNLLTFTVDHFPEARALADYTLVAEKSADGFTSYRWG